MNRLMLRLLSSRLGADFEIRTLTRQTAAVFNMDAPRVKGISISKQLKNYACFTSNAARQAIENGEDLNELHQELYHMACGLGESLIRWMKPADERERQAIFVLLYRNLGITIREKRPNEFCVYKCYFAAFYSPEICDVISGIDQGIFAGILGGGTLTFHQRITEGCPVCRADLIQSGQKNTT